MLPYKNKLRICQVLHINQFNKSLLKACVLRIIDIDRFSKRSRLIRTVAWVFRFIRNLTAKIYPVIENIATENLNASELRQTENLQIISVQDESFKKELNYLLNPKKKESCVPPTYVKQFCTLTNMGSTDLNHVS